MSKLSRAIQKIFGSSGVTSEFGQIGSKAAGAPVNTKNLTTMQALTEFAAGLNGILSNQGTYQLPYLEDLNSILFLLTSQLAYLYQNGIPEWLDSADQRYYITVSFVVGSDGAIYQAILGDDSTNINTQKDPILEPTWWKKILDATMIDAIATNEADIVTLAGLISALSNRLDVLEGTGTPQGTGTGNSPTFLDVVLTGIGNIKVMISTLNNRVNQGVSTTDYPTFASAVTFVRQRVSVGWGAGAPKELIISDINDAIATGGGVFPPGGIIINAGGFVIVSGVYQPIYGFKYSGGTYTVYYGIGLSMVTTSDFTYAGRVAF